MPLLDAHLIDVGSDDTVEVDDGLEFTIGQDTPFTTVRPVTQGPNRGYKLIKCKSNNGSRLYVGFDRANPLAFFGTQDARVVLAGFEIYGGFPTFQQPHAFLWHGSVYMDLQEHWAKQADYLDQFQVDVTKVADASYPSGYRYVIKRRSGPSFTSSMVGRYCQVWSAGLGDPNLACGTVRTFVDANTVYATQHSTNDATKSATNVRCYIGTSPRGGSRKKYQNCRGIDSSHPNAIMTGSFGTDFQRMGLVFGFDGATDFWAQGFRSRDIATYEYFDPTDAGHGDGIAAQFDDGANRVHILDGLLQNRIILDDANDNGSSNGHAKRGLEFKRLWHDAAGNKIGFQRKSTAGSASESRGLFGPVKSDGTIDWAIEDITYFGVANPTYLYETIPDLGVTTTNTAQMQQHTDRINLPFRRITQQQAAPGTTGDTWTDPAQPGNLWRAATGHGYGDIRTFMSSFLGWKENGAGNPDPKVPIVFATTVKGTSAGTSITLTSPSTTPADAHIVVAVACSDPTATVAPPAGWANYVTLSAATGGVRLWRFIRNARAVGGTETLGPFTTTGGTLTAMAVFVQGTGDTPVIWDFVANGNTQGQGAAAALLGERIGVAPGTMSDRTNWTTGELRQALTTDFNGAGMKCYRHDVRMGTVGWSAANPTAGNWVYDAEFDYAIAGGANKINICFSGINGQYRYGPGDMFDPLSASVMVDMKKWWSAVINRYSARWGSGVQIFVSLFNEQNITAKGPSGYWEPKYGVRCFAEFAKYIRSAHPNVKILFGSFAPDASNAVQQWSDVFSRGGSGTPTWAPIDAIRTVIFGTGDAFSLINAATEKPWQLWDGFDWHAYLEGDPFAAPSARPVAIPTPIYSFPANWMSSHHVDFAEIAYWLLAAGCSASKVKCWLSECGASSHAYYDPLRVYSADEQVFLDLASQGTTDGARWNNTTRHWSTRSPRYKCLVDGTVGVTPGTDGTKWALITSGSPAADWNWGRSSGSDVREANEVAHLFQATLEMIDGRRTTPQGANLGTIVPGGMMLAVTHFNHLDEAEPAVQGTTHSMGWRRSDLVLKGDILNRIAAIAASTDATTSTEGAPFRYVGPGFYVGAAAGGAALSFFAVDQRQGGVDFTNPGEQYGHRIVDQVKPSATVARPSLVCTVHEGLPAGPTLYWAATVDTSIDTDIAGGALTFVGTDAPVETGVGGDATLGSVGML